MRTVRYSIDKVRHDAFVCVEWAVNDGVYNAVYEVTSELNWLFNRPPLAFMSSIKDDIEESFAGDFFSVDVVTI